MIKTRRNNDVLGFERSIIRRFLNLDGKQKSRKDIGVLERAARLALTKNNLHYRSLIRHIHDSSSSFRARMKENNLDQVKVSLDASTKMMMANAFNTDESLSYLHGLERYNQRRAKEVFGEVGQPLSGLSGTKDVYRIITDMILEKIEKDKELAWRKPWQGGEYGIPASNFITRKPYRGFNWVILNMFSEHSNPYWLTFSQVTKLGGKVKKGAESEMVIYYELIARDEKGNRITVKEYMKQIRDNQNPTMYPLLRYYRVFNGDDIEGIKWGLEPVTPLNYEQQIESAEKIVNNMPNRPTVNHGGSEAFYTWIKDYVQMPEMKHFEKEQFYYSTLFHELSHSTRHPKRLNQMKDKRPQPANQRFGDPDYAREELVAEMSAAFLCGEAGILYFTLNNSAAYLKGWRNALIKHLKKDKKFILKAASLAQESADYILGNPEGKVRKVKQPKDRLPVKTSKKTKSPAKKKAGNLLKLALNGNIKKKSSREIADLQKNSKAGPSTKKKAGIPASNVKSNGDRSSSDIAVGATSPNASGRYRDKVLPKALDGFLRADQEPEKVPGTFRLKGPIGEFLGEQQRFKLAITISGQPGAGKTWFSTDLIDAFIDHGFTVGMFSIEQGGMESKDTKAPIEHNIKPSNRSRLAVTGEAKNGIDTVKQYADRFDVIVIDSWQKLGLPNTDFDRLRQEHPNTIWIVIFQLNAEGGMRNGVAAEFDAPVVLKAISVDPTGKENYIRTEKNRLNRVDLKYMIHDKVVKSIYEEAKQEDE